MPAVSISLRGDASGSSPVRRWASLPIGEPWASMPTASITASGPRPPVVLADRGGEVVVVLEVERVDAVRAGARSRRSGTRSTPMTCSTPRCWAMRVAISPIGPRPSTSTAAALGHVGVLHRLPRGRQHVGEVDEAVVGRAFGDLDRAELRLRDAQELGLAARDLAVELGVAEQRRARAVLVDLRGLALRHQALVAHAAVPAGDVERDHDAVAGLDVRHLGADLLDDAHRLVAEDVALVDVRRRAPRTGAGPSRRCPTT